MKDRMNRNVRNLMNALINNIVKDTFIIEILLLVKEKKTKGRKFYCDNTVINIFVSNFYKE